MGEERYRKRVLETWPCGCRMWRIYTRVGDSIEQKELERREMCWGLESLFELRERAEQRQARAYSERGEHSPEYKQATTAHIDILAEIEEHYSNSVPNVEILNVWPQD